MSVHYEVKKNYFQRAPLSENVIEFQNKIKVDAHINSIESVMREQMNSTLKVLTSCDFIFHCSLIRVHRTLKNMSEQVTEQVSHGLNMLSKNRFVSHVLGATA